MRRVVIFLLAVACDSAPASSSSRAAPLEVDRPRPVDLTGARLPDGRRVVSRLGSEPGESELVLIADDGAEAPLAPAPGPDDLPTTTPDGRVIFVSGRSSIASVWIADPRTGQAQQLTNLGLVAGGSRERFVAPPHRAIEIVDGRAEWLDGHGERHSVELPK